MSGIAYRFVQKSTWCFESRIFLRYTFRFCQIVPVTYNKRVNPFPDNRTGIFGLAIVPTVCARYWLGFVCLRLSSGQDFAF
jgi:hypothetical protein